MERRSRLSRSRDFDAVYRHGRSVSTRYLTLHWFPRDAEADAPDTARLGLAVPRSVGNAVTRNRLKRQLREAWRSVDAPPGCDYVLVARTGLAETIAARDTGWLTTELAEVVGKARP